MNNIQLQFFGFFIVLFILIVPLATAFDFFEIIPKTFKVESYQEVDENLNLYFSQKSTISKNFPENIGFLKMTGEFTGEGAYRVVLSDGEYDFLVVDDKNSMDLDLKFDEAFLYFIQSFNDIYNYGTSEKLDVRLSYHPVDESVFDYENLEADTSIIGFSVAESGFDFPVNESQLCSNWMVFSIETGSLQSVCYGADECCSMMGLESFRANWNDTFHIYPNKMGATNKTIVGSTVNYVNLNEQDESFGFHKGSWRFMPIIFYSPSMTFDDTCVNTCNINPKSRALSFKIYVSNGLLNIKSMKYGQLQSFNFTMVEGVSSQSYKTTLSVKDLENGELGGYEFVNSPSGLDLFLSPLISPVNSLSDTLSSFNASRNHYVLIENLSHIPYKINVHFNDGPEVFLSTSYVYIEDKLKFDNARISLPAKKAMTTIVSCNNYSILEEYCSEWNVLPIDYVYENHHVIFNVNESGTYAAASIAQAITTTTTSTTSTTTSTTTTTTSTEPSSSSSTTSSMVDSSSSTTTTTGVDSTTSTTSTTNLDSTTSTSSTSTSSTSSSSTTSSTSTSSSTSSTTGVDSTSTTTSLGSSTSSSSSSTTSTSQPVEVSTTSTTLMGSSNASSTTSSTSTSLLDSTTSTTLSPTSSISSTSSSSTTLPKSTTTIEVGPEGVIATTSTTLSKTPLVTSSTSSTSSTSTSTSSTSSTSTLSTSSTSTSSTSSTSTSSTSSSSSTTSSTAPVETTILASTTTTLKTGLATNSVELPEDYEVLDQTCIIDEDCPPDLSNGYYCEQNYLKEDVVESKCLKYLGPEGVCISRTTTLLHEWCGNDQICDAGKMKCAYPEMDYTSQEKPPHGNPFLNHPDHKVEIMCYEDNDCGFETKSKKYCNDDGNVVFDEYEHVCILPGTSDSTCKVKTTIQRVDYCGPDATCLEGKCIYEKNPKKQCEYMDCAGEPEPSLALPNAPKINYLDYAVQN